MKKSALVLMYREHAADFRHAAEMARVHYESLVEGLTRKAREYELCADKISEMEDE